MRIIFSLILMISLTSCGSFGKKPTRGKDIKDTMIIASYGIKACYQAFIDRGNEESAKNNIQTETLFNDLGYAIKVKIISNSKLEPQFKDCIREEIFKVQIPKPSKSQTVSVKQPFNFYVKK